jgi:hypothetical protein
MNKLTQTRLHNPPHQNGNCFAAVIGSLIGLDSAEEVIQIQDQFHDPAWPLTLNAWLSDRGYVWGVIPGHIIDEDTPYLVIGPSPRGTNHVCIYQKGELIHDPHPEGGGLLSENLFEAIVKL